MVKHLIIKNYPELASSEPRRQVLEIMQAGFAACDPARIVADNLSREGQVLSLAGRSYNLAQYRHIYVIGFGKMAAGVARQLEEIVPVTAGLVISSGGESSRKIKYTEGSHPFPTIANLQATLEIMELAQRAQADDLVICIVSGGGSAMLCCPSLDFDTYLRRLKEIIFSGVDIRELNRFRTANSLVKGGKLAKLIAPARLVNLYFSDVIGNDFKVIASGPTYTEEADNLLLLDNRVFAQAMAARARQLGLSPCILTLAMEGEASRVVRNLLEPEPKPGTCLIAGGETTVKVKGSGRGGRSQELCLGALERIKDLEGCALAGFGSDGIDGVTNAAGALIDAGTWRRAAELGLDPARCLAENDSYHFFESTGDLIFTGPTGINVMDFVIMATSGGQGLSTPGTPPPY